MKAFVLAALLAATNAQSTPTFCNTADHNKTCDDWRETNFGPKSTLACADDSRDAKCTYCCMRVETVEWPTG